MSRQRNTKNTKITSPKQLRFVQEYLIDLNGTAAAIRAGYSPKSAKFIACELLKAPHIQAAIAKAQKERGERTQITADNVLREIERMAMFDPATLVGVKEPNDIKTLPEDVRRAIVGWGWDKNGNFVLKMAKETMLPLLANHHGLVKQKLEHTGKDGQPLQQMQPVFQVNLSKE